MLNTRFIVLVLGSYTYGMDEDEEKQVENARELILKRYKELKRNQDFTEAAIQSEQEWLEKQLNDQLPGVD